MLSGGTCVHSAISTAVCQRSNGHGFPEQAYLIPYSPSSGFTAIMVISMAGLAFVPNTMIALILPIILVGFIARASLSDQ